MNVEFYSANQVNFEEVLFFFQNLTLFFIRVDRFWFCSLPFIIKWPFIQDIVFSRKLWASLTFPVRVPEVSQWGISHLSQNFSLSLAHPLVPSPLSFQLAAMILWEVLCSIAPHVFSSFLISWNLHEDYLSNPTPLQYPALQISLLCADADSGVSFFSFALLSTDQRLIFWRILPDGKPGYR